MALSLEDIIARSPAGRLAVSPEAGDVTGQAIVGVNVTDSSTAVLAANTNRQVAIIVNDSDTTVYAAIGQTAVANQGIRLNANGGVLNISKWGDLFSTQAVNAIHASTGNKVVVAQEFH